MGERQAIWPAAETPPPGWLPASVDARLPMLPTVPTRPTYREAHPITVAPLLAGMGATLIWFALFGSIGRDLVSYAWWTVAAGVSAWLVAGVLTLLGDRGVAVGVALVAGGGLSVAGAFVLYRWVNTNDWPMW